MHESELCFHAIEGIIIAGMTAGIQGYRVLARPK